MPYAANADVSLYFESFGDPADETLVLVNGLGSQCINYRVEWCERFVAAGFHVVRMDNRDVGLTTKFNHVTPDLRAVITAVAEGRVPDVPYTLSDMAADVVAVLDALGVARAHVMGLSLGGMIVQTLAIEHPDRMLSMTSVMSTTGDPDVGHSTPEALAHLMSPAGEDRDSAVARHLAGLAIWGSPGKVDVAAQARYVGEAYDRDFTPTASGRQIMASRAGGSRTEALRHVRVPTLVVHGSADTLIDRSGGRRTAEVVPGARYVEIEGMGHDYPEVFWDRWVELVREHATASTRPGSVAAASD